MKMNKEQYNLLNEVMRSGVKNFVDVKTAKELVDYYIAEKIGNNHEYRALHDIKWSGIAYLRKHDYEHSFFVDMMYNSDNPLNDTHIDTAIKKWYKENINTIIE